MTTTPQSFLASRRDDASQLVQRAKEFSERHPVAGRVSVPPPDQLALYGGLGVLAALNVINWPVALAIGAGTAVVARRANARRTTQPGEATPQATKTQATSEPAAEHEPDKPAPQRATPKARGQGVKPASA
jgi:xanthosine utilization system XapX-like protein